MKNKNNKQKAIFYIIISAFCFAVMNCCVKLAGDLPTGQKSFYRNLVAVFVALFTIIKNKTGFNYKIKDLPLFIVRASAGTMGILGNFYAIDHMPVANASMLNKMSPFFAVIFSFLFLKERPKLYQVLGIFVAFLGAMFIIKPGGDFGDVMPALVGFCGGMGAGCAYTAVRALGERGVKGSLIVLFFSVFSCLAVLPLMLIDNKPMSLWQLAALLGAGVAATGGQFSITAAYANAPAKEISVFDYTQIIFATVLGFILFAEIPDVYSFIGYGIICSVSVFFFLKSKNE
ncbi:MAG: DMT family transporter [Firmicutes bacterium]|nr:DMT family transporter [Bacillota bacterium]